MVADNLTSSPMRNRFSNDQRPPLDFSSTDNYISGTKLVRILRRASNVAADMRRLHLCVEDEKCSEGRLVQLLERIMVQCPRLGCVRVKTRTSNSVQKFCADRVAGPLLESLQWRTLEHERAMSSAVLDGADVSRLLEHMPNLQRLDLSGIRVVSEVAIPRSVRALECSRTSVSVLTQLLRSSDTTPLTALALNGPYNSKEDLKALNAACVPGVQSVLTNVRTLTLDHWAGSFPTDSPCTAMLAAHCLKLREVVLDITKDDDISSFAGLELLFAAMGPGFHKLVIRTVSWWMLDFEERDGLMIAALLEQSNQNGYLSRLRELHVFGIFATGSVAQAFRRFGAARRVSIKIVDEYL
ncbi:hypothetical protein BKA62DRAFT_810952 [Auriculariales sp. MPI-PUGE-AT-0066]|nr:hypothetical protein BKA62DRAFT_810952 [Auriculariales sp. MPI-PUGE-AT-0066]